MVFQWVVYLFCVKDFWRTVLVLGQQMNILREFSSLQIQLWGNFDLHEYEGSQLQYRLMDILKEKEVHLIYNNDAVVETEEWGNLKPKHLLYTPFRPNIGEIPDTNYSSFPKEQMEKAKISAKHISQSVLKNISPNSFQDEVFDWTLLTDPIQQNWRRTF